MPTVNIAISSTKRPPFVYLTVAQQQPIRVLQLLQSGRRGKHADTDLACIEI